MPHFASIADPAANTHGHASETSAKVSHLIQRQQWIISLTERTEPKTKQYKARDNKSSRCLQAHMFWQ